MTLLPDIDAKKTANKAHKVLAPFRNYVRLAGDECKPQITQTYSVELKTFSNRRSEQVEEYVARKDLAEREIKAIVSAYNLLNAYDRQRIYDRYMSVQEWKDVKIYYEYAESESTFYRKLNDCLLKFAEGYENGRLLTVY